MLFVPWVIGLILMITGLSYFVQFDQTIMQWLLFEPGSAWWWQILYFLAEALVYIGAIVLTLVTGLLLANVIAAPIYEIVSVAVEKDLRQGHVGEISLWQSLKIIPEELKKVTLIILISILVLLIPGVNVLAIFVTAFLTGWDFYDYPLARRGWSFRERLDFVKGDIWAVMGLGVWMTIPFIQLFLLPLAVAGGTMLNLERLAQMTDTDRRR
jgi:uncharacterized protein involved in cysteine biosynthesis